MRRSPIGRSGAEISMPPLAASMPGGGAPVWDADLESYRLAAGDAEYRLVVGAQDERTGLLRIEGRLGQGEWLPLLRAVGMLYREVEGGVLPPSTTHQRWELCDLRHSVRSGAVHLVYREELEAEGVSRVVERTVEARAAGGSLELRVEAPGGMPGEGFCGLHLGALGPEEARSVTIPGLPDPLVVLPPDGFSCAYVDRYLGGASSYPGNGAFYRPDTEGRSAPVAETFYVTLSADPLGPLPALRRPTAPYRIALESRVTLDFYSEARFAEDERLLRLLQRYGLDDVMLIYRNWQQFGYGRRSPALYPANPDRGTNEEFRHLLQACAEDGWLVALREEYGTLSDGSPYWSDKVVAHWPDGLPRKSRRPGQFGIAPERMLDFARLETTKIQRNYRPTAVFVDGHTAWSPETCFRQLDSAPNSPGATEAQGIRHLQNLAGFLRDVHEGPVLGAAGDGPARFDTFAEGLVEGVVRGPDGGASAPLILDYELREVRPHLVGIGCGSYRQFCSYPTDEPVEPGRVDWDAYRATEIALGHTGYVGNYRVKPGPRGIPYPGGSAATAAREYYLLRALQELYVNAPVQSILYAADEELLTLGDALLRDVDLAEARARIEYANGLVLWVNRGPRAPWTVTQEGERWELPPSGFLAVAPRNRLLAFSALVNHQRTDFCRGGDYTFLDVRGTDARSLEGITTDGAAALLKSRVQGRHDVVLVGAQVLSLEEGDYHLSERADLRLTHLSPRELELTIMDSASGKPVQVQWPGFSAAWRGERLRVSEHGEGEGGPGRAQVSQGRGGPQLTRARPGVTYRVTAPAS